MKAFLILLGVASLSIPASADISDSGNLSLGNQAVIQGTMTVVGNFFSVGGSSLTVVNGNVGISTGNPVRTLDVNGSAEFGTGTSTSGFTSTGLLQLDSNGIKWADGSTSTTAASGGAVAGPVNNWAKLNVKVFNDSSSTTTIVDVTADVFAVGGVVLTSVSTSASTSVSGAGGIDTGSVSSATWYSVFVITNNSGSAITALLSISSTTPTLPAGYTNFRRVDWVRTDANKKLIWRKRLGDEIFYVNPAKNTLSACSGTVSLASYVPSTSLIALLGAEYDFGSANVGSVSPIYPGQTSYFGILGYDVGAGQFQALTDNSQNIGLSSAACVGTPYVIAYWDPI